MTDTSFRSSFESREEYQQAASVKGRTVIARFDRSQGGMFPLNNSIVGEALLEVVPEGDVVALGCLRGNHEWHVTLATQAATEALLATGRIRVRGPGPAFATREGYLEPLVPTEVNVRVLWCPAWVAPDVVFELLMSIGEVAEFERCRSRLGNSAVPNLQYTAVLKKVWPSQVPDRVSLEVFGEKLPLLLITKGKPRCCFLCGSCSHTQAACPDPYCRYCNRRGHFVTNCPKKKPQGKPTTTATTTVSSAVGVQQPVTQQPATEQPVGQQPAAQQLAAQQPTAEMTAAPEIQTAAASSAETSTPTTTASQPVRKAETKRRHEKVADTGDADGQPAKVVREAEPPTSSGHPDVSGVVPETQLDQSPVSPDGFADLQIDLEASME